MSGVKAGWYPDYADADGQLRYWDGQRWTDQRMPVGPTGEHAARELDRGLSLRWVYVAAAAVVAVLVIALGVSALRGGDDDGTGRDSPVAETSTEVETEGPTSPEPSGPLAVVAATDSVTLELSDGASVRLRGLVPPVSSACAGQAADVLASLVVDKDVTLVQKGQDLDAEGNLLRYVDRDGLDVGLRMIQRGLVTAGDEVHPRAAQYHRVDDRTPAACS